MTRRLALLIIGANLAAAAVLAFAYPHLMLAPGALRPAHAALATDCFACHAPLDGTSAGRCIACHAVKDIGLRDTKGVALAKPDLKAAFHRELIAQDCAACHSDHQGLKLTQGKRKAFSHALLQPAARERCESCHEKPADTLHRQISGNCAQCHTPAKWKPANFDHARYFVLDRDHDHDATCATCVTCHANNDYKRYTCYGCHEHTQSKVRAKHVKEGIREFENCVECHRSANEHESGGRRNEGRGRRERD